MSGLIMRTGKNAVNPKLREKLPALWAAGVETKFIASRFGVTPDTVRGYVREMGLPARNKKGQKA